MKYCLTLLLCILFTSVYTQTKSNDSLRKLSYEQLLARFEEVEHDSILAEPIAREYLERARREGDTIKMARGYDRLARIFHHKKNIAMADSLIALTKDIEHITYPGLGYMLKANNSLNIKDELDNLLTSYYYAERNNNIYQKLHIFSILFTKKNNWGQNIEALQFLKRNELILKDPNIINDIKKAIRKDSDSDFLAFEEWKIFKLYYTLDHIEVYIKLEKFDSAAYYIKKAKNQISKGLIRSENSMKAITYIYDIKNNYYQDSIQKVLDKIHAVEKEGYNNYINQLELNFFWGMALIKNNNYKTGLEKLKKADSLLSPSLVIPEYKVLYDTILKYESLENNENYFHYLNKSMKIDSVINENLKIVIPNIIRFVETPQLIAEKQKLINDLDFQNKHKRKTIIIAFTFLALSLILIIYFVRRNRHYQKRFKAITSSYNNATKTSHNEIPSIIIKNILDELEHFEKNFGFIDSNITLNSLAKKFGTNERYLSKVVNMKKGKHFPTYLNDLRVDYAVDKCQNDPMFRKFTIKAIGQECGFNSAESFSRAFYRKLKIYPSYYLKNLNNRNSKNNLSK